MMTTYDHYFVVVVACLDFELFVRLCGWGYTLLSTGALPTLILKAGPLEKSNFI